MTGNIRTMIDSILSEKGAKKGLHVNVISAYIFNETVDLFALPEDQMDYQVLKKKVNAILAAGVKKKKGGKYRKVKNPKTEKFRKGFYKI
jgi:hypothetical protein